MKLRDWLRKNKISQNGLADDLGVTQSCLSKICNGRIPSVDMMRRIARITNGEVMPNDFFDDLDFERKAA
jgi:transcriptional regulator with XRE-family HTH domain